MPESDKLLVCGNVLGRFKTLFKRVKNLNKIKGPFEALYCVGNFFHENDETELEELLAGKIEVPIMTYILSGSEPSFGKYYDRLEKVVPNIIYLGKFGHLITTSGLKIAYLSGVELPADRTDKYTIEATFCKGIDNKYNNYFCQSLVKSMIERVGSGIDILLTSSWPKYVTNYTLPLSDEDESKILNQSILVSCLAKILKPRYHFCGTSDIFYERPPYRNHKVANEKDLPVTRFFSVASVPENNSKEKKKWLYAFSILPQCHMEPKDLLNCPGFITENPYTNINAGFIDEEVKNYFFEPSDNAPDSNSSMKRSNKEKRSAGSKIQKLTVDPMDCWFCLANPEAHKQLIISVGKYIYFALAKGVLVSEHGILVPKAHVRSCLEIDDNTLNDIIYYEQSLAKYFHERGQDVVFFERNYRSPHLQIQVVPIPKNHADAIDHQIFSHTDGYRVICKEGFRDIKEVAFKEGIKEYLAIEVVVDKKCYKTYIIAIEGSAAKHFPLQMGRAIIAEALDIKDRTDWKVCVDDQKEIEMAVKMREKFKDLHPRS